MKFKLLAIIILIILLIIVILLTLPRQAIAPQTTNPTSLQTPEATVLRSKAKIFMIALDDNGKTGEKIGCNDSVIAIDHDLKVKQTPLIDALNYLLSKKTQTYEDTKFYNALYQSNLQIEKATINDEGKAEVYLVGTYALGGVCDAPRFKAQLEKTTEQFSKVQPVSIFINNKPIDEILSEK